MHLRALKWIDLSRLITATMFTPNAIKNICFARFGMFDRFRQPGHIDEVLPVNVFGGDITAPGTATQAN